MPRQHLQWTVLYPSPILRSADLASCVTQPWTLHPLTSEKILWRPSQYDLCNIQSFHITCISFKKKTHCLGIAHLHCNYISAGIFTEWASFFWVHGEWIGAWDKQITWIAKRFSGNVFVPRSDSSPMKPEKKTLIPYIYNVSIKDLF